MKKTLLASLLLFTLALATVCAAQTATSTPATNTVAPTEMSADLGPCSVLFTVNGKDGKPLYNAKITTRLRYGVGGFKRIDLEASTNSNGQAKFIHLPSAPKKPIFFYVSKDEGLEIVEFSPEVRCQDEKTVTLK
jgi:hypothetical protein